jgi:hypothetical protein
MVVIYDKKVNHTVRESVCKSKHTKILCLVILLNIDKYNLEILSFESTLKLLIILM